MPVNNSILEVVYKHGLKNPSKIAVITDNSSVSYELLNQQILTTITFLSKIVKKESKVLIASSKEIEFIYVYFAVHALGGICVVVDSESNESRIDYIVSKTQPVLIVGNLKTKSSSHHITFNSISNSIIGLPESSLDIYIQKIDTNSICDILFTTGTTGNPKGVLLSHKNTLAAANQINSFIGNSQDDVEMLGLPISHSFGLGRLRCALYAGSTIILLGSFANLKLVFSTIERHNVTIFGMVPSVWNYIKKMSGTRISKYSSSIKYIEIGSAAMPIEDKLLLMELFPTTRICMHYGLTEASRATFIEFHSDKEDLNSIGKCSPSVEVKVFDENGIELSSNETGEICVKGKMVLNSYLDEADNVNAFYGEYFRTGDWGFINKEKYIYLVARKKELLNVGGKKVSPLEIENALSLYPGIIDSACIGIPDPNGVLGEVPKIFIVKQESISLSFDEIKSFLRNYLEAYKIPVEMEYIDSIPTTPSGKKQRLLLQKI